MVQAILEHKEEAIKTPLWYSVLAAYKSATALTSEMRRLWLKYGRPLERMGPFWSHCHSAAVGVSYLSCSSFLMKVQSWFSVLL